MGSHPRRQLGLELGAFLLAPVQQVLPVLGLLLPEAGIQFRKFVGGEGHGFRADRQRSKEGLHSVVVFRGNGIVLVVVAAGAAQGHSQEYGTGGPDHVIEVVPAGLGRIHPLHEHPLVQEPGGDLALRPIVSVGVSGELLPDEAVVGHVAVEGADHVVPVAPHVRPGVVDGLAHGVRIPHQVEPMSSPTLAVGRIVQQLLDGVAVGVLRGVFEEGGHGFGGGWKTGQSEVDPSQQGAPGCLRSRLHALFFQGGQDERINRVSDPLLLLYRRDLGRSQPGPGPAPGVALGTVGRHIGRLQPVDPVGDPADLSVRQPGAVHRHCRHGVAPESGDQGAGGAVAGNHRRSIQRTPLQQRLQGVDRQSAQMGLRTVATPAVLLQDGPDVPVEADLLIRAEGDGDRGLD